MENIEGEDQTITQDYSDGTETKKDKSIIIIGISLICVAIIIGAIIFTVFNIEELDDITIIPTEKTDENIFQLQVTDQPPNALSFRDVDYVKDFMNHQKPTIEELKSTLHWAKETASPEHLKMIEKEILAGAKENQNNISKGEQAFLEIINWTLYPEICDQPDYPNCEFFDIIYHEAKFQLGEITRDEYWLSVKKYANQTVIDKVEGTDGS